MLFLGKYRARWAALVFQIAALAFLGFAAALALQLALAEAVFRGGTTGAVAQAISLQGGRWSFARAGNSSYYERLAALDPDHARSVLAGAVEVNPRSGRAWIELGLAAERAGDFADAERALLRSAGADHQYLPAWTLANFYFRRIFFQHADARAFWLWARRAAAFGNEDLKPLLALCDRVESDGFTTRLGESPDLDRAYLDFFILENRLDSAQRIALQMAGQRTPSTAPRLIDFTDRQLRAGHGNAALELWSALAAAQFVPFPAPDRWHALTNGDFKIAPTGHGFDWRLLEVEGVATESRRSRGLEFSFSGSQPEACRLLEQFLPLEARRYRLRFEYSSVGMPPVTGIRWTIESAGASIGNLLEGSPIPQSDAWSGAEWIFPRAHSGLARLALIYQREPGTTRAEGRFEIRNLRLEAL